MAGLDDMGSLAPYMAMMGLGQNLGGMASSLQGKQGGSSNNMMSMLLPLLLSQKKSGNMESQLGSMGGMTANPMYNWMT